MSTTSGYSRKSRSSASSDEDSFGPGMDLMMALFTIIAGILALVVWQKDRLQKSNLSQSIEITSLKQKLNSADKTTPLLTREQLTKLLAEAQASLRDLQQRFEKAEAERRQAQAEYAKAEAERQRLEQLLALANTDLTQTKTLLADATKPHGDIDLEDVRKTQSDLIKNIVNGTPWARHDRGDSIVELTDYTGSPALTIITDADKQTLRFGSDTLFDSGSATAKNQDLLAAVARIIQGHRSKLQEIQIHGHTDTEGTANSNLYLAASRAFEVYKIFAYNGIDPATNLMSLTSYGYYKPVTRLPGQPFSLAAVNAANAWEDDRKLNRRVDVFLIYKTNK